MKLNARSVVLGASLFCFGAFSGHFFGALSVRREAEPTQNREVTEASKQSVSIAPLEDATEVPLSDFRNEFNRILTCSSPTDKELKLAQLAAHARSSDLAQAFSFAATFRCQEARMSQYQLIGRWGRNDIGAAFVALQSFRGISIYQDFLRRLIAESLASNEHQTIAWLQGPHGDQDKNDCLRAFFEVLGATDPRHAISVLDALVTGGDKAQLLTIIFEEWAENDPKSAANAALGTVGLDMQVYKDIAYELGLKEPRTALKWAQSLPLRYQNIAVRELYRGWAHTDPVQAAAYVGSEKNALQRTELMQVVAGTWGSLNPAEAMNWAISIGDGMIGLKVRQAVVEGVEQTNPALGCSYATNLPSSYSKQGLLRRAMTDWAKTDPESATAWFKGLAPTLQRDLAEPVISQLAGADAKAAATLLNVLGPLSRTQSSQIVADAWAKQDLQGASDWVESLPKGELKDAALKGLVDSWAKSDPRSAADYAVRVGGNSNNLLANVAFVWASTDPETAATWAQQLGDEESKETFLKTVVDSWGRQSPIDAANYAAGLPTGPAQDEVVQRVLSRWVSSDPGMAASWVGLFPEGQLRDKCIKIVADGWSGQDPQGVGQWLSSLSDSPQVQTELRNWATSWISSDGATARSWIQSSSLPEQTKAALLTGAR